MWASQHCTVGIYYAFLLMRLVLVINMSSFVFHWFHWPHQLNAVDGYSDHFAMVPGPKVVHPRSTWFFVKSLILSSLNGPLFTLLSTLLVCALVIRAICHPLRDRSANPLRPRYGVYAKYLPLQLWRCIKWKHATALPIAGVCIRSTNNFSFGHWGSRSS